MKYYVVKYMIKNGYISEEAAESLDKMLDDSGSRELALNIVNDLWKGNSQFFFLDYLISKQFITSEACRKLTQMIVSKDKSLKILAMDIIEGLWEQARKQLWPYQKLLMYENI